MTDAQPARKPSPFKIVALVRAVVAYAKIVRDPNQLGEVFQLADSLSDPKAMARIVDGFRRAGADRALVARKRVRANLSELEALPEGTLGRAYATFMRKNGLAPEALPNLEAVDLYEFVRAHLYETHDMWHALTGFEADVAGELGLQGFYAAQIDGSLAPAILAAGLLNTALFALDDRERRLDAITRGWEMGKRAKPLFGFDWAASWARPLADVRRELGIDEERPTAGSPSWSLQNSEQAAPFTA
ncbi:MAG: Coq4 family protein [Polyangiaceae bacterium]